jgi:hypothetical protein
MISAMHPDGAELYIAYHCWVDRENSAFGCTRARGTYMHVRPCRQSLGCIKISGALTPILASIPAFALVHNNLMISAVILVVRNISPYHCWVTDGENSVFWVHKSKRRYTSGPCRHSLAKCINLACADPDSGLDPAFALVHNSLMISASRWLNGTVYRLSLGGQMGRLVFCTRARGR